MRERVAARRRRKLGDDPDGDCLAEDGKEPSGSQPARPLQQVQLELPPDDGRDPENHHRLVGQGCDAAADQRTNLLRNAEEGILGRLVEAPERVVGRQQANDLSEEEGVAAGDLVQSRHGLVRRLRPGDGPDVGLEVRRRQTAKRDPCSDPGELGEDVTELADPPLRLSVGRDEQDAGLGERVAEEAKQQQRRLVRGVDVVERDEERLLAGSGGEEATDRVEQANALALRHDRVRCPAPPGMRVGGRGELLEIASEGADDLHPRPVRRSAALLPAATGDDAHAVLSGDAGRTRSSVGSCRCPAHRSGARATRAPEAASSSADARAASSWMRPTNGRVDDRPATAGGVT